MTNLVAIVTLLVTNTVTTDNGVRWPQFGNGDMITYPPMPYWQKEPDEQYETTDIVERKIVRTEVDGQSFENVLSQRKVSSVTKVSKKVVEWRPAGIRTNDVTPLKFVLTNGITYAIMSNFPQVIVFTNNANITNK